MSTIAHNGAARVVVGIDTHKDEHVAVAVDGLGVRLGDHRLSTTIAGYADLEGWAAGLGDTVTFGVEGTGSYGAGLARFLSSRGHTVIGAGLARAIPSMQSRPLARCWPAQQWEPRNRALATLR